MFLLVTLSTGAVARADCVTLKSGGEIRGELLPDQKDASRKDAAKTGAISIRTLSGATVAVVREEIALVVRRRAIVEEYETRRRAVPTTVAAHWEIADWCRQKSLSTQRLYHLQQILELDPEHEAAHRGLGHIRAAERWTTSDELLDSRGYVWHKGQRVLPQELALIQEGEQFRQAERSWFKRVKQWQVWLNSDRSDRQLAAVQGLSKIREADAILALVRSFRHAPEEAHRLLLVSVLGQIEGDRPISPLVVQSVLDDSRAVRDAAINAVRRKGAAKAVPVYVGALKSRLNTAVNRAATALGQLADESALPYLIEALVTPHGYYVAPSAVSDLHESDYAMEDALVLGSIAGVKSSIGHSTALSSNRAPTVDEPDDEVVQVEIPQKNPDVLAALVLLTGQNFGFEAESWRTWHRDRQLSRAKKRRSNS
jgi:hypothetical protein